MLNQNQEAKPIKKTAKEEGIKKYLRLCCNEYKAPTELCDHTSTGKLKS